MDDIAPDPAATMQWFDGRVLKQALPCFDQPPGADAPLLKRLVLAQGELAQFADDSMAVQYAAYLEFKPGILRGNHFHKLKDEWVYVICGEVRLFVADTHNRDGAVQTLALAAGDRLRIQPGIAHAFRSSQGASAIEFSPNRFDPSDTLRYVVAS